MLFKPLNSGKTSFQVSECSPFSIKDLSFMDFVASSLPLQRTRVCLHSSPDSIPQDMLIYFQPSSRISISSHNFSESFAIITGSGSYRIFFTTTSTYIDVPLSSACRDSYFYLFIPCFTPHVFSPSTSILVSETGFTKLSSKNNIDYCDSSFSLYSPTSPPCFNLNNFVRISSSTLQSIFVADSDALVAFSLRNLASYLSIGSSSLFLITTNIFTLYDAILIMPPGTSFALPSTYSIRSLQLISGCSEDFSYHDVSGNHVDSNTFEFFPVFLSSPHYPFVNTSKSQPLIIKLFLFKSNAF